ncbi:uncharacterized protein LOC131166896 [Malania oleifera]|uniref:uncharacterized protein LOC131166896 n=1 Tax=Malania oleifera TaxID=397392 RepID=UPI0025AE063D|nr:uncharacterized protein LOC131166896 [Malania oleifera]
MEFCPSCGMFLRYELPHLGRPARFYCSTCPYVCYIENKVKIKRKQRLVKKEIEPIFSSDDMENGPVTEATCPQCDHGKAAYQQMQIRSADEPMTTFYSCLNKNCRHVWRED